MYAKTAMLGNRETRPVFICETDLDSIDSVLPLLVQNWNMQLM